MSITPIAFVNDGADIAVDSDLYALHPELEKSRWRGKESYRDAIQSAYDHLAFDISRTEFSDASLIAATADNIAWYKRAVVYQSLVRIFRDFRAETGDRWDMLIKDYQRLYDQMIQSPTLEYDVDESGTIDDEENPITGNVELVR